MRLALAVAAAAFTAACSPASPPTGARDLAPGAPRLDRLPTGNQPADQAALDSARQAIRTLAGGGACADGRCAALAVGAKPCGGPWEWVRYCPTSPDADRLRALAGELERANRAFNERYGVASTCDVALPPDGCQAAQ